MSSRGKLPRSTPPHLAAAFLLPQLHHLICWQAYPLNQMPLRGLPPQAYLDLSTSRLLGARLRRQAALAGRSEAASAQGQSYWCETDSSATSFSDLCENMTRACVLCVIHTGKNIQKV